MSAAVALTPETRSLPTLPPVHSPVCQTECKLMFLEGHWRIFPSPVVEEDHKADSECYNTHSSWYLPLWKRLWSCVSFHRTKSGFDRLLSGCCPLTWWPRQASDRSFLVIIWVVKTPAWHHIWPLQKANSDIYCNTVETGPSIFRSQKLEMSEVIRINCLNILLTDLSKDIVMSVKILTIALSLNKSIQTTK